MHELIVFLFQVIVISLSGVIAPGPVTAAALAGGTRWRHAGGLIALGHGVVEFPLIILIVAGADTLFKMESVRIGIGLAGGCFLLFMGVQMLRYLGKDVKAAGGNSGRGAIWTGAIVTGGNPYFLIWWATTGLALAGKAIQLGWLAFGLFAAVHWLCDLTWLEALSLASFKGSKLLSGRIQTLVLSICAAALLFLGFTFVSDAGRKLIWSIPGS